MCIFVKIFNKMATKQYLDAETIPYQVILREADGSYIDQYLQSFYVSREGGGFRANGGAGAHFLKRDFSAIDWGACLPLPDPIPTDTEGYMAYLSLLFTGQQGTLVPPRPEPQAQYFYTTPLVEVEPYPTTSNVFPYSGGNGQFYAQDSDVFLLGFDGIIEEVIITVTQNTLNGSIVLYIFYNDGTEECSSGVIAAGATGHFAIDLIGPDMIGNQSVYLRIDKYPDVDSGTISFSVRTKITPTV